MRQKIKQEAKNMLLVHFWPMVGALGCLAAVMLMLYYSWAIVATAAVMYFGSAINTEVLKYCCLVYILVLGFLVVLPLKFGIECWYLRATSRTRLPIIEVIAPFCSWKNYCKAVKFTFLRAIYRLFWCVLYYTPVLLLIFAFGTALENAEMPLQVVIASLGFMVSFVALFPATYAVACKWQNMLLAPAYMLLGLPAKQALRLSKEKMQTHVFTAIKQHVTFLPLLVLCMLVFPMVYVLPYFFAANSIMLKVFLEIEYPNGLAPHPHVLRQLAPGK